MRKLSMIILFATLGLSAMAQNLIFHSAEFELGVKKHLGLNEDTDVLQSQADTITSIDLSGLGITDIRDVKYLPQVKVIDLSNNGITDTLPLTVLDSLQLLNLCNNELESINPLVFSNSNVMKVLIAYNYINDFTFFLTPAKCQITLVGINQQLEKNAPYFDVYQLYADVNGEGMPMVCWRGYTNSVADVTLRCGMLSIPALLDGNTNIVSLPHELSTTSKVILSDGEMGDTTYVVPPKVYSCRSGEKITIDTELPESYQIGYLHALHGTVEADGVTLHYVAPSPIVADTLYMSYYEGNRLRGFTQMYVSHEDTPTDIQTPLTEDLFTLGWNDGVLSVSGMGTASIEYVSVYDATGRLLVRHAGQRNDSGSSALGQTPNLNIPLEYAFGNVVIVQITANGRTYLRKVVLP